MSLKTCSFDMDVPRGVLLERPLAEGAPAVFENLLEVFAPRMLWIQLDSRDVAEIRRTDDGGTDEARWLDEEIRPGEVLTRCPPGPRCGSRTRAARPPGSPQPGVAVCRRERRAAPSSSRHAGCGCLTDGLTAPSLLATLFVEASWM